MTSSPGSSEREQVVAQIQDHPYWYHAIEVLPGIVTPGLYDLRRTVGLLPWPDLQGRRCLDVGTSDGFFAFEMERRGAAEVVAIDIQDHLLIDWPFDNRPASRDDERFDKYRRAVDGTGFRIVAGARGSKVEWVPMSVHALDRAEIGEFDVVFCGSMLEHIRDPVGALQSMRGVCRNWLLSSEQIALHLSLTAPRRPMAYLNGTGPAQWWMPNVAGHERMLYAAGFAVHERSRPYVVPFNHPQPSLPLSRLPSAICRRVVARSWAQGPVHRALLARPAE